MTSTDLYIQVEETDAMLGGNSLDGLPTVTPVKVGKIYSH